MAPQIPHTIRKQIPNNTQLAVVVITLALLVGGVGYAAYATFQALETAGEERAALRAQLASTTEQLSELATQSEQLADRTQAQQEVLKNLDSRLGNIDGQVSQIQKLQNTDPELLAKYSKTYFLNEHYEPQGLATIPEEYRHPPNEEEQFHAQIWSKLESMFEAARGDGIELKVVSAYRSFSEQEQLKAHYDVVYGESAANQFSAAQGYSEHQLGTTVDFTTESLGADFTTIDTTQAYTWLQEHAHEYGFVLSYPSDNGYYRFEPWHWRYVGVELAQRLEREGEHFYDLPQRTIDTYRDDFFE